MIRSMRRTHFSALSTAWTVAVAVFFLLAGCDGSSPTEPPPSEDLREVGVVLNSVEETLTIFDVDAPHDDRRTVELQLGGDGSPVGLSTRAGLALVPMGVFPAAQVVDLETAQVVRTITLPEGSEATGSTFLTDSTALVANPGLGTVSHVNVWQGTAEDEVAVGLYPQGFVHAGGTVFVIDAQLENFAPVGPGRLVALDPGTLEVIGEVVLSGENPGSAVAADDGRVFVLNGGRWGADNGSLSVVDPVQLEETGHHMGFGDLPGTLTLAGGLLHASSWNFGVIAWDPDSGSFHRGLDNPIQPGGVASTAGLGVDSEGRLYTLFPDCEGPSRVLRMDEAYEVDEEIPVGICPAGISFIMVADP